MYILNVKLTAGFLGFCVLSACGGSSSETPVVPLSVGGFARSTDRVDDDAKYVNIPINLVSVQDGVLSTATGTIDYERQNTTTEDGPSRRIIFTLDGETTILTPSVDGGGGGGGGGGEPTLKPNDTTTTRSTVESSDFVRLNYLSRTSTNDAAERSGFRAGYFIEGFDTDPASDALTSGNVTYTGDAGILFQQVGGYGFGGGAAEISVDFGSDEVNGTIQITERAADGATVAVPNAVLTLEGTRLDQNGFRGTFSATGEAFDNATLDNPKYTGRLFGDNAQSAAGLISGQLNDDGEITAITGGYLADR